MKKNIVFNARPMLKKKNTYVAMCIEAGEKFTTLFKTVETSPTKLLQMGSNLASDWGGECYQVKKYKAQKGDDIWDCDISTEENLKELVNERN